MRVLVLQGQVRMEPFLNFAFSPDTWKPGGAPSARLWWACPGLWLAAQCAQCAGVRSPSRGPHLSSVLWGESRERGRS